jgi:membrane-associated protease RseP (regulator of RpoE activity)
MSDPNSPAAQSPQWEHVPRDEAKRLWELAQAGHAHSAGGNAVPDDEWAETDDHGPNYKWPIILFLATCASTYFVQGLVYACGILTILLCHEFGHYIQARRYRVAASLPWFIPMPISPLGTMGAVIGMSGRIPNRKALFDIGISGPLAGLVPALVCCWYGVTWSTVAPVPNIQGMKFIEFGDPLILQWITHWIHGELPPGMHVWIHPLGLAGWAGIFVTALNLIPIGQLDGGHILYAMLRKMSYPITTLLLYGALGWMIISGNYGWMLLVMLLLMSGPMHPPTHNDAIPLGTGRTILGWLTLCFIFIGFTPVPIRFYGG